MIYLNGTPLIVTEFPDNTSQVWKVFDIILKESNWAHITWKFNHEGEFMALAQLKTLLDSYEVEASLTMDYLPYGRQDKRVSNTSTFALHTFASLLNNLKFNEVIITDPHSLIALELIKNSRAVYPFKEIMYSFATTKSTMFCYPDAGAHNKYGPMLTTGLYGNKVRDQQTGNILHYDLVGDPKDQVVLIVDDICDGGMTFILLVKKLLEAGAKEVSLFVSHGIFSKGIKILKDAGIKRIFTKEGEIKQIFTKEGEIK